MGSYSITLDGVSNNDNFLRIPTGLWSIHRPGAVEPFVTLARGPPSGAAAARHHGVPRRRRQPVHGSAYDSGATPR